MDDSFAVSDSTDWLQTSTPQLAQVEAALRCQVCKDFYDTPMITSCSHTFCSLCIRRCLTTDGKCPLCRAPDQELRLRRNCTVEELVEVFQIARPALILSGKPHLPSPLEISNEKGKRSLDDSSGDQVELGLPQTRRRKLRSQNERLPSNLNNSVEEDQVSQYQPADGLTACPICNQRMKEQDVFLHLDVHSITDDKTHVDFSVPSLTYSVHAISNSNPAVKSPDRLPQLNYSLLKDNALRKKLAELGIPIGGPRALLIRRHTEWVNMVNANRDSSRPRTKREMLQELEIWDRTQGRQISKVPGELPNGNSIMSKEFDGSAWALSHDNDFRQLISNARRKLGNSDRKEVDDSIQSSLNPSQDLADESTNLNQVEQQNGLSDVDISRTSTNPALMDPDHDNDEGVSIHPKRTSVIDLEADD